MLVTIIIVIFLYINDDPYWLNTGNTGSNPIVQCCGAETFFGKLRAFEIQSQNSASLGSSCTKYNKKFGIILEGFL